MLVEGATLTEPTSLEAPQLDVPDLRIWAKLLRLAEVNPSGGGLEPMTELRGVDRKLLLAGFD